ncbi:MULTISPECIES: hypothetical protein [Sphingomonadaceae]|uniref:hypothetical protein n=1 Tax=Sphingomonadales TaxID=204457 RepID=UPI000370F2A6|nr:MULTISPECIES: hypothetical protein [Sphingomonadaceae]NBB40109.1 hypothetical protein [Sphingobium yanoikuyae]
MLYGFGSAPVCVELDLDSYDGPWTHVERFRGRSGWLVVAEAEVMSDGTGCMTSIVAACDDHLEAVPTFMAPNLLACACSLPVECDEYPPDELDDLLAEAARELKLRWLRDNNAALAKLTDAALTKIGELEGRARRDIDGLDYRIADLRRRRRMSGVTDAARDILEETILAMEHQRDAITERLARRRAQLRLTVDREERVLIARARVNVAVEPLYFVRWSAGARPNEDWELAREQSRRFSSYMPGSLFDPNRTPSHRNVEAALSTTAARRPSVPVPPPVVPVKIRKADHPDVCNDLKMEREQLSAELSAHERRGAQREDGSRKFIRYGERRRALIAEIANLDRRIAAAQPNVKVEL